MVKRKQRGRPAGGNAGEPLSSYRKITISMKPATRAQLDALSSLTGQPAWRIVEQAIALFIEGMPAEDRRALKSLAKQVEARTK